MAGLLVRMMSHRQLVTRIAARTRLKDSISRCSQMQKEDKPMKYIVTISRILLGLIFVVFGLNGFLHFVPTPGLPSVAQQFMGAIFTSHFCVVVFVSDSRWLASCWVIPLATYSSVFRSRWSRSSSSKSWSDCAQRNNDRSRNGIVNSQRSGLIPTSAIHIAAPP